MRVNIKQFIRKYVRKKPIVIAALQSPHLLNIWVQSKSWRLYYDLLGDHDGLEESKDLEVPRFNKNKIPTRRVSAVLVTSPLQLENARNIFPSAKIYWVVHTGYFLEVLPTEHVDKIDGIITLSNKVLDLQLTNKPPLKNMTNFVIPPFYRVNNIWKWHKGILWTIRSRANSRMAPTKDRFDIVTGGIKKFSTEKSGVKFLFYGQEAPQGYINNAGKNKLFKSSSAYISALPVDAGFGLAEHEAMSHGVPIVGSRWGDTDKEIDKDYPSLVETEEEMIEAAHRIATDKSYAERASLLGIKYIKKHRNKRSMDNDVKKFALHIQGNPLILL